MLIKKFYIMQQKLILRIIYMVSSFLVMSLVFSGCSTNKSGENTQVTNLDSLAVNDIFQDIGETKKIFYSLPSPLETAMLIKTAGATYNQELLNPVENSENYATNRSKALNLGIYTTDLSFASLFDQTQASINYMNAAKEMADGLGILDAINNTTIERLEENVNNRDVIMDIISETFLSSSSYLKENNREAVATIVLVGGWIEGLYIGTQLAAGKPIENNKLVERIAEQKLSFEIVQRLLNEHMKDQDVSSLMEEIEVLAPIFDEIIIESTPITVDENEETKVATLNSQSTITISEDVFERLTKNVQTLRNKFIL